MKCRRRSVVFIAVALLLSCGLSPVSAASETVSYQNQKVDMEKVFNFRELGGYRAAGGKRVKRGILFRSGELTYATNEDIRTMSEDLGIKRIIDLRYGVDRKYCPDRKVPGAARTSISIKQGRKGAKGKAIRRKKRFSALAGKVDSETFYGTFASTRRKVVRKNTCNLVMGRAPRKAYKKYFRVLLNNKDRKPVLFHCIAGKDRTGVAAYMTLLALGVDEKTAYRDYCMTNSVYKACHAGDYGKYSYGVSGPDLRRAVRKAKKKYGSYQRFLRKAYGLSKADLKKLRGIYLE